MLPEPTIQALLEAAEVAGMPTVADGEDCTVLYHSTIRSHYWAVQAEDESETWLPESFGLAILLEHLRRWLWEEHRVWIPQYVFLDHGAIVFKWSASRHVGFNRWMLKQGQWVDCEESTGLEDEFDSSEEAIAAAVQAMKENDES